MKKIFIIVIAYVAFIMPASAQITTENMTRPEIIINQGYSPEVARLINLQNAQATDKLPTYNGIQPVRYKTKIKPIDSVVDYFLNGFVGSDDGQFGKRQYNPSPNWEDL